MNITTRMRTSTGVQADYSRNQKSGIVVSRQGDGHGRRRSCGRGKEHLQPMGLSASISGEQSITLAEGVESCTNEKHEGIPSTESDELYMILSGSQPVLTQESLTGQLLTTLTNIVYDGMDEEQKLLDDTSVG